MDSEQNYFELLGLAPTFDMDLEILAERYRQLQRACHPDRFAGGADQRERTAAQYSARINDAVQILRTPTRRARYLLELAGVQVAEATAELPADFLMEQIERREALAEAEDIATVEGMLNGLSGEFEGMGGNFAAAHAAGDLATAEGLFYCLQFLDKLRREAEEALERLEN